MDCSGSGDACDDFINLAFQQQGNINIYDIYADVCNDNVWGSDLLWRLMDYARLLLVPRL